MEIAKRTIQHGVYLVVDPSMPGHELLNKLQQVVSRRVVAVQVWDNFVNNQPDVPLLQHIAAICHACEVPVIINNQWQLIQRAHLDGVHFDTPPDNLDLVRQQGPKDMIIGLTCGNNLDDVRWAEANKLDYISFCSIFPSATANSCELVSFDTIAEAGKITAMPIFLAGGIRPGNLHLLQHLHYAGVAVVSGIMSAGDPALALEQYYTSLNTTIPQ